MKISLDYFTCSSKIMSVYFSAKSGCHPEQAGEIVKMIKEQCPNLKLEGLMTIGAYDHDFSKGPNPDFQVHLTK